MLKTDFPSPGGPSENGRRFASLIPGKVGKKSSPEGHTPQANFTVRPEHRRLAGRMPPKAGILGENNGQYL
jgi:hypothetical protein